MSFASLLRELRQFPRALAAVAALSVAVGLVATFRVTPGPGLESRRYEVGYARAAALVDTRRSQAIDAVAGGGSITGLADRAVLLADLMTRSPLRGEIADRAGIPPDELLTRRPMNGLERRLTLPEVSRATVDEGDREATLMHVAVNPLVEGESPIIGVEVRAPDPVHAARVADAAVATVRAYLERSAPAAVDAARRLEIRQVEPAGAVTAVVGSSRALAVLAAAGVFMFGCAATLAIARVAALLRRRRFAL